MALSADTWSLYRTFGAIVFAVLAPWLVAGYCFASRKSRLLLAGFLVGASLFL